MITDIIVSGTYGRLAIGLIVFINVIAYNETGAITVLFSAAIATLCATFSAFCKSSLNHLQLSYLRSTHKFDFFILFLAIWCDILTLICACSALTRTISVCLDSMSGGMARIYILGRNAPENEPWPDAIGFSIIFIVSVMFMLGLENSLVFSYILLASVCGIIGILITITSIRGNIAVWQSKQWLPKGYYGLINSAAALVFAYPSEISATGDCKRLKGTIINICICATIAICVGCLTAVITFGPPDDFIAVPILSVLEKLDFHNFEPAIACLYVLVGSCALIELFSEMFGLIVTLTTSEWKILSRQIGYEHGDSGSPVLAVFTGGSICAIIAFACPLEMMIYFIGGSQLFSALLRAFYLFYSPFRPKYMNNSKNDTSLGYSQLPQLKPAATTLRQSMVSSASTVLHQSNVASSSSATAVGDVSRRILRCLSKPSIVSMQKKPRHKKQPRTEELEREWLLLGEPTSPRNTIILDDDEQDTSTLTITPPTGPDNVTPNQQQQQPQQNLQQFGELQRRQQSSIISNGGLSESARASDDDGKNVNSNSSSSDSSTDIDAAVDEYRQKVEVTTSGPSEKVLRIPSQESWQLSIILMGCYFVGIFLCVISLTIRSTILFGAGIVVSLVFTLIMLFLPRYSHSETSPTVLFCSMTIFMESVLFGSTCSISIGAITAWLIAGILIYTRCDTWFSLCIEQPVYISHIITPAAAASSGMSNGASTSTNMKSVIRLPRPPKGSIVSTRIRGHCR